MTQAPRTTQPPPGSGQHTGSTPAAALAWRHTTATIDPGDNHPWHIDVTWAPIGGRPEPVAITLHRGCQPAPRQQLHPLGDGPAPITATTYRALPIAAILRGMRVIEEAALDGHAQALTAVGDHPRASQTASAATRSRQGRHGTGRPRTITPDHLKTVAAIYSTAWQHGQNPTQAVAQHLVVTPTAAAKQVARARAAGHLPPATRGRAIGNPAPPA